MYGFAEITNLRPMVVGDVGLTNTLVTFVANVAVAMLVLLLRACTSIMTATRNATLN